MSNTMPIDANGRAIQCAYLGNGSNYETGNLIVHKGLMRFKNIGNNNAIIRYNDSSTDGVVLSPGETEYFYVNGTVKVVDGTVNAMR